MGPGDGTLVRGGAAWVYRYGRQTGVPGYIDGPDYWKAMQDRGPNAARLIAIDPWQRSHGSPSEYPNGDEHGDLHNPEDVAALLNDIDAASCFASNYAAIHRATGDIQPVPNRQSMRLVRIWWRYSTFPASGRWPTWAAGSHASAHSTASHAAVIQYGPPPTPTDIADYEKQHGWLELLD